MTVISFKYMADAAAFLRTQAQVERSVTSIGQRFRESAVAGVAFAAGYKAFDAATNAIGNTAGAVVKYATDLQGARVAWSNLLGSQQAAEAQLLRMQQTAANTPFDFPAVEMGTRRFMAMGFSLSEATEGMNAVIAAASGLNTGTAGIESMVRALGQMRSNVRVNAEDMNQLVDAQVPAWKILAEAMGKSEAEVRKLSEEGKIMSSTFITAFQSWSQARFGDAVVAQSKTLTGALSTIRDNILGTGATAIQPFIELLTRLANRIATFTQSPAFGQWAAKVAAGMQVAIDLVGSLAGYFQSGLQGVLAVVSSAGQAIYEALSWINPFARHSPSLVEQVEAGVDRIIAKYAELSGGVATALQGAQGAVQSFLAASAAGMGAWEESQRQAEAETLAVFGEGVPAAYLAARQAVEDLRAGLAPLAADIERQQGVVDDWAGQVKVAQAAVDAKEASIKELERAMRPLEEAVKSAQAALEGERQELDAAKDAVDSLKNRLGEAQQRLQDFAKTPLAGTRAFADRLFAIEQQAAAVELALVQWKLSPELSAQLADLSGRIAAQEGLVGQWAARVRDAEAAIKDQEAVVASWQGRVREAEGAVKDQEAVVGQWSVRIKEAQRALEEAERGLDVWKGRIADAEGAVKDQEATVAQWTTRIREAERALEEQVAALDGYKGRIREAEAAIVAQEEVVAAWAGRVRDAERALKDQEAALSVWDDRIRAAEGAVKDQEAVVAGWTARIREAERALRDQEAALDGYKGRIREAEGAVKDQQMVVDGWSRTLREAQRALAEQEAGLAVWDGRIRAAEDAVEEQQVAVVVWTARIRDAERALKDQEAGLAVWEGRIRAAQAAVDDQEGVVKGWTARIREAETELRRQERSLDVWQDRIRAAEGAIEDQERAIRAAEAGLKSFDRQVDEAKETLDRQKMALVGAKDQVDAYADGLKEATRQIDTLARAQIKGSQGFSDQAFAIEQQAAAVKFALNDIQLGVAPTRAGELLRRQLARAQEQAAATQGTMERMYATGIPVRDPAEFLVASNANDVARERVSSINRTLATLDLRRLSTDDIAPLKEILDELGMSADQVRLREKLELDPLRRDVERLAEGTKEVSFSTVVDGITAAKQRQAELTAGQAAATAAWERQATAVDAAAAALAGVERARDGQRAAIEREKQGLQELRDRLDEVKAGYESARAGLEPYRDAIDQLREGEAGAKEGLDRQRDALDGVKREYEAAKMALDPYRQAIDAARRGEQDAKEALDQQRTALAAVKEGYEAAKTALDPYRQAVEQARLGEQGAKDVLAEKRDALDGVKRQYDEAQAALDPYRQAVEAARLGEQGAKVTLDERRDALAGVKDQLEAARAALDPYRAAVEQARLGEQDAKVALDERRAALDGVKREYQDALDALEPYRQAIEVARRGEQDAKDILGQKRDALQSVKDGYEAAKAGLDPYRQAVEEARRGEEDAKAVLDQKRDALAAVKVGYDEARAGLDVLKGALDAAREGERAAKVDLDALSDAFKAAQQPPAVLTAELERLRLEAQEVKLQEQLQLDPLRRQIEQLANPVKELTFAEIVAGMAGARAEIATLEPQLVAATAAWEEQRGAVARAEGALKVAEAARDAQREAIEREQLALVGLRDQLEATQGRHRAEQDTLAGMQDAYSAATAEIARMEQQLDGVQRAAAAATQEAERLRKEQEQLAAMGQPKMPAPIYDPAQLADQFKQLADTKERFETTKSQIEARVALWKERIRGYYDEVRAKFEEVRADVAAVLGPAFDWLEKNALPVVIRFAGFVRDHFGTIATAVAVGAAAFQGLSFIIGLAATIIAAINPVTLIIGGLSVAAGLLAAAWKENWGDIRGKTAEVVGWLTDTAWPLLQRLFGWLKDDGLPAVRQGFQIAWGAIAQAVGVAFDFFQGTVWPWLRGTAFPWLTDDALPAVRRAFSFAWQGAQDAVGTAHDFLQGTVWPALQRAFGWLQDTALPALGGAFRQWWPTMTEAVRVFGIFLTDVLWPSLQDIFETLRTRLLPLLAGAFAVAWSAIRAATETAYEFLSRTLWPWLRETAFPWLIDTGLPALRQGFVIAWSAIERAVDTAYAFFRETVWPWLRDTAIPWLTDTGLPTLRRGFDLAWQGIAGAVGATYDFLRDTVWPWLRDSAIPWLRDTALPRLQGAFEDAWAVIGKAVAATYGFFRETVWPWLQDTAFPWLRDVGLPRLREAFEIAWERIRGAVSTYYEFMRNEVWPWLRDTAIPWLRDVALPQLRERFERVWSDIGAAVGEVVRVWRTEVWPWLQNTAFPWLADTGLPVLRTAFALAWRGIEIAVGAVFEFMRDVVWPWLRDMAFPWIQNTALPALLRAFDENWARIKTAVSLTYEFFRDTIWPWLAENFRKLKDEWLPALSNGFWDIWGRDDRSGIRGAVGAAMRALDLLINNPKEAIKNALLWPFEQLRDNIGGVLNGMKENMLTALRGARGAFVAFSKAVGGALNWIAEKIPGVTFRVDVNQIEGVVPAFATGARNFTGGPAIVGEEGPELVVLPRHATVVPADLTRQLLDAGVPGFASGLNLPGLGDLFDVLGKGRDWVFDRAKEAVGLGDLDLPGALSDIGRGFANTLKGWTLDHIERLLKGAIPATPTAGGVGLETGVRFADAQLGKPYVWGGGHGGAQSANEPGWDCSGFVSAVLKAMGIAHPRYGIVTNFAEWMEPGATGYVDIGVNNPYAAPDVQHMGMALGNRWYESRGDIGAIHGRSNWQVIGHPPGLTAPPPPADVRGQGPVGSRGGGWGDPVAQQVQEIIDRYGQGRSPFKGSDVDRLSAQYGIPEGLILGLLQKESQMGSNAGGLAQYHNYGGITGTEEDIRAGRTVHYVFPNGDTREFLKFGSPSEFLDYKYRFLLGGYYKNQSLERLLGNYYAGPNAIAKYGNAATDAGDGGAYSANGTVQDYINLVSNIERQLTGNVPDQRGVVIGNAPAPTAGPDPGVVMGPAWDGWSAPLTGYTVTQEFGRTDYAAESGRYAASTHSGIDLSGPHAAAILAAALGAVTGAGWNGGYGNAVTLDHGNGLTSIYGHMQAITVALDDVIARGRQIGVQGNTGNSDGEHLHFEIRRNGAAVNPREYVGLADGGIITEPVVGRGQRTGRGYRFGEAGPEGVFNQEQLAALVPRGREEGRVEVHAPIEQHFHGVREGDLQRETERALRRLATEWGLGAA